MSKARMDDRTLRARPEINVTPLVDVLLVLLIIFMVIAPSRPMKLPVKAAAKATRDTPPDPSTLVLTLSADSQLSLNRTPVTLDQLIVLLIDLMDARPPEHRTLFIMAPPRAEYGSVVRLVDHAKERKCSR